MAKTYEDSSGKTFATHDAAAASNTSMGTNPSVNKASGGSSSNALIAQTKAMLAQTAAQGSTPFKGSSFDTSGTPSTPQPPTPTPQVNTAQPSPATTQIAPPSTQNTNNLGIVDTLNQAGQPSDFASRNKLAGQYGIQNYTGTADQNTTLADKYRAGFNNAQANKVTPPQSSGQGSAMVNDNMPQDAQKYTPPPEVQSDLEKTIKTYTDAVSKFVNPTNQRDSLVSEYDSLSKSLGIPGLKSELLDINRIMDGTEDDIRSEVTAAGGFATESQVQAMTIGRNKSLLKKAQFIQDQITSSNDELNMKINLTKEDKQFAQTQMSQGLSAMGNLVQIQQSMHKASQDNYNTIIQHSGYDGLLAMTGGNPYNIGLVEQTMGLDSGGLQKLATQDATKRANEQVKTDLQNQILRSNLATDSLQRQKITQDIENGKKTVIPAAQQLSQAQGNIDLISGLTNNGAIRSAVGGNPLARFVGRGLDTATGARQDFIAGVQQLTSQLTLDSLINAKAKGATFGALSEGELNILAGSASKLNTWAIKDKSGNVTGYNVSEKLFKKELDKINNFAKLDYIIKGGVPDSVNVKQMPDGSYQTLNSDGSVTTLQ